MGRYRNHLARHWERDPLARELERPTFRSPLEQRAKPLISVLERDSAPIASGGWSIGEPLFRDELGELVTQAQTAAPVKSQARGVVAPTHKAPQSDRRNYHPLATYAPALSLDGVPAEYTTAPAYLSNAQVAFKHVTKAIPCVIRTVRREVMFAKRHAGKGYKVRKRRTWMSEIPC